MTTHPNHNTADQSGADERAISAAMSEGNKHGVNSTVSARIIAAYLASTQPAQAVPAAWIATIQVGGGPEDPPDYDVVAVPGDTKPDDRNNWTPLYATPQPFPAPAVLDTGTPEQSTYYDITAEGIIPRIAAPAVQSGELPELPTPWGYARNVDGRIQVSVGPERPPCNERGSGYFTPWAAMYGGDQLQDYARQAIAQTAPAVAGEARTNLLAKDHTGMRVDYRGLLGQSHNALRRSDGGLAEMLRQLEGHMLELGVRWYSGDTAVVDEILQLYCVEQATRKELAAPSQGAKQ